MVAFLWKRLTGLSGAGLGGQDTHKSACIRTLLPVPVFDLLHVYNGLSFCGPACHWTNLLARLIAV